MDISESQAKKIGGRQGLIVSVYFCIILLVIFTTMMFADGITSILTTIKMKVENPEYYIARSNNKNIVLILIAFVLLIGLGYLMGRNAGKSIIIKGRNYLGIGYLSMLKTIIISSFIESVLLLYNYSNGISSFDELKYYGFFWLIWIVIYVLPSSLIGLWLGNRIDNERIKYLVSEVHDKQVANREE